MTSEAHKQEACTLLSPQVDPVAYRFMSANEILILGVVPALRDLYRRRWDLYSWCHSGSTRFISLPMRSLQLASSRLYAIYIAADEIFIVDVILALRDSHRRR
jgi:hypothetical protein